MLSTLVAEIPPVLIQKEVAEKLGVTDRTLRNWNRDGFGPRPVRVGGILLYDVAAVEAFSRGVRA